MTSPRRYEASRSWSAVLTLLLTGSCVLMPPCVAVADFHKVAWRAVMNHGRIPDGENVVVATKHGTLQGRRIVGDSRAGGITTMVDWFLGVPYAKPPTGTRRFKMPVSPNVWTGTRPATKFGSSCPQKKDYYMYTSRQSEDCLYLNVYTPYQSGTGHRSYPVMIYIHGGSYRVGSGMVYPGYLLAQSGVVVITFNYRLGLLGFLCGYHPSISGNYGLFDQIEALKWVRNNIAAFRGNPREVTIFGNSAGASSVGLLNNSPLARGLFIRAIAQSGSALALWGIHNDTVDLRAQIKDVMTLYNCDKSSVSYGVECLRGLDWTVFTSTPEMLAKMFPTNTPFKPCVDSHVITAAPHDWLANGGDVISQVFMTGIMANEWSSHIGWLFHDALLSYPQDQAHVDFSKGMERTLFEDAVNYVICKKFGWDKMVADMVISEYTDWTNRSDPIVNRDNYVDMVGDLTIVAPTVSLALLYHGRGVPVYAYAMSLPLTAPTSWRSRWGSYHTLELNYIFGAPFVGFNTDDGEEETFSDGDRNASLLIMTFWSNFAKFGDPTPQALDKGTTRWRQFIAETTDYLAIGAKNVQMKHNFRTARIQFWNELVPNVKRRIEELKVAPQVLAGAVWPLGGAVTALLLLLLICLVVIARMRFSARKRRHMNAIARL